MAISQVCLEISSANTLNPKLLNLASGTFSEHIFWMTNIQIYELMGVILIQTITPNQLKEGHGS